MTSLRAGLVPTEHNKRLCLDNKEFDSNVWLSISVAVRLGTCLRELDSLREEKGIWRVKDGVS